MSALSEDEMADLARKIAALEERLRSAEAKRDAAVEGKTAATLEQFRLETELRAALDRQKASAEILRNIATTSGSAEHALRQIAETTAHFFNAPSVTIRIAEGDRWVQDIRVGSGSLASGAHPGSPLIERGASLPATVYQENRQIHIGDLDNIDPSMAHWPAVATRAVGIRTISGTPLRREGKAIGALIIYRDRLAPFTEEELALQQSFADQAVIAIENARLFNETQEALERQTATSDILRVINNSTGNLAPVFECILEKAHHLCGAPCGSLQLFEGDRVVPVAVRGMTNAFAEYLRAGYPITEAMRSGIFASGPVQHIDFAAFARAHPDETSLGAAVDLGHIATMATVPLVKDGVAFGRIVAARQEIRAFTDKQIALLQGFADQAVIAIENARLFNETQEALERQTATGEILASISSSITDPKPVFDAVLDNLLRLFGTRFAAVFLARDGTLHLAGLKGEPGFEQLAKHYPAPIDDRLIVGKAILAGRALQIAPILDNPEATPGTQKMARELGYDAIIAVPMIREGKAIGVLATAHRDPIAFSGKQIQLATSFADQAVIAIENARLFNETQEALARQTATSEILRIISQSPTDVRPVFDAIVQTAVRLIGCETAFILRCDGVDFWAVARCGREGLRPVVAPQHNPIDPSANFPSRAIVDKTTLHLPDWSQIELPEFERRIQEQLGYQSAVYLPLLREGVCIGVLAIAGSRPRMFGEKEIALAESFCDQAVIAIENARLFNETQEALARQTATSEILRVISGSPTDVQPVFDAIVQTAVRLLGCDRSFFMRVDGLTYSPVAGVSRDGPVTLGAPNQPIDTTANFPSRAIATKQMLHLPDWARIELPEHEQRIREMFGVNSALYLPLVRGEDCVGLLILIGSQPNLFGDEEIALAESFRDQALIAIENVRLFNETKEALERQTATADILKVIASSPSDVQPVFDAIAESAKRLLGGFSSTVYRFIDGTAHLEAFTPTTPEADEILQSTFPCPVADIAAFRMTQSGDVVKIPDTEDSAYELTDIARARGYRSMLFAPLMNKGASIGFIAVTRVEPGNFADHHVQLLQTFADQAVIAIENARLFNETKEALERQTATADILKVIASSPSDVRPVFDAIAARAKSLLGGYSSTVFRFIDGMAYLEAFTPTTPEADEFLKSTSPRPVAELTPFRLTQAGEVMQIPDTEALTNNIKNIARARGFRSMLFAPLMNKGTSIGFIAVTRVEPGNFTDHHVQLLQTFADQAVIAIENVRLFDEVQAKTRDLEESLQQQTATADVLKVISRSAFDLQPVFNTIVQTASRLCEAEFALIYELRGDRYEIVAANNAAEAFVKHAANNPLRPGRGSLVGRTALERKPVHIPDCLADPEYSALDYQAVGHYRAMLGVPLLREGVPIGVIGMQRTDVRPFADKQIELVQTFADQAVIAIENARLFDEVQARTRELEESLQQQTATSEVLQVISASPGELGPVFDKMLENATRVCGAGFGSMVLVEGDMLRQAAFYNAPAELAAVRTNEVRPIHPLSGIAAAVRSKHVVQVEDIRSSPAYGARAQHAVELAELGGARTLAVVPMVRDDEAIGVITVYRQEVRPFGEKQIDLLTNFARQAVIAIENARLLGELRQRTSDLSKSLHDLRTAQDRLVQTEKLASLGQLTAGIAHEIKNPLNFVNNFSALSIELTDELNDTLKQATLAEKLRGEVDELTGLLKDNLSKVVQHGKRADSIVKNMLLHSREGTGEHRPADVNALVDESLNLAYHGARAEKPQFNVTLKRNFDPDAGTIEVFPQEITRVLLNLISNGFYAVTKRKAENGNDGFEPLVTASTRGLADRVEIRIRDNGTGIAPDVKEKMFNPFFTTKPAGEGTGLGLSMTHDIVVKQHGGTIEVETEPGTFTEFLLVLPRSSAAGRGDGG